MTNICANKSVCNACMDKLHRKIHQDMMGNEGEDEKSLVENVPHTSSVDRFRLNL